MPACNRVLRVGNPWLGVLSLLDKDKGDSKVVNHQMWRCWWELLIHRPRLPVVRGSAAPASVAGPRVGNLRRHPWAAASGPLVANRKRPITPATNFCLLGAWRCWVHSRENIIRWRRIRRRRRLNRFPLPDLAFPSWAYYPASRHRH